MTVRSGLRAFATALLGGAFLAAGLGVPSGGVSPVELTAASLNPVAAPSGGVSNVTFYYGGATQLQPGADLSVLGRSSIVVATPKADEAAAVAAIHSTGAKAYRYVQFFWAPEDSAYEGINLAEHPDWAFCLSGSASSTGRTTGDGTKWDFIDANEKAVRAQFKQTLAGFKADGWDGVMFDRGQAATQYAADAAGRSVWDRTSSCTQDPYQKGATFADAYVNMLGLAHAEGLQAMMNNGQSPFDASVRMRPDPHNASCRAAKWSKCHFLSDIWSKVDLVLNETPARPKDEGWARTFAANQRSESDAAHGRRTVDLITTASLRGAQNQTPSNVFYQWSRIKLFDLAVSVNTGDGGCPGADAGAACNRYGTYPQLTNIAFGKALHTKPTSQSCVKKSKVNCVWVRTYAKGMNLVNASRTARTVKVSLGTANCRYVLDVYSGKPVAGNKCVKAINLTLPAWSGRPLTFSTGQSS